MAPIYDTDIAEERWSKSEWDRYELWEKVEVRLRRKKLLWIGLTVAVFLLLSAVPILMEHLPKWRTLYLSRKLAQQINQVKKEAAIGHEAYRLRFDLRAGALDFVIEKAPSCGAPAFVEVRKGTLASGELRDLYTLLSIQSASDFGIPGLIDQFCYDPILGSEPQLHGQSLAGFGFISVKDLAERRQDRMSLLLLTGSSAEISFE